MESSALLISSPLLSPFPLSALASGWRSRQVPSANAASHGYFSSPVLPLCSCLCVVFSARAVASTSSCGYICSSCFLWSWSSRSPCHSRSRSRVGKWEIPYRIGSWGIRRVGSRNGQLRTGMPQSSVWRRRSYVTAKWWNFLIIITTPWRDICLGRLWFIISYHLYRYFFSSFSLRLTFFFKA